ncbi:MAG: TldE/PmbA family protein [Myxococcales bacterium]|nr:MAG: TldE/PmbA family protein [Myxococcales bacterium]
METYFDELAGWLPGQAQGGEQVGCWLSAERSDFVRFNRGKVRQAGSVRQQTARLQLTAGRRQASSELSLTGHLDDDRAAIAAELAQLRALVDGLPDDPHILVPEAPSRSRVVRPASLPPAAAMVDDVARAAAGHDLVGILASGPVFRGFCSSIGHHHWHEVSSVQLDYSLHRSGDQAVKDSLAGFSWQPDQVSERVARSAERLAQLDRAPRQLSPGRYRAFLEPAALAEIVAMLNWGGFSCKALRTRQSPLSRLAGGEARLSPLVTLTEQTDEGLAPAFQGEGFPRPAAVPLVAAGQMVGSLVAPRSAREYGLPANGASASETAESLSMAAGTLPASEALAALGTGLWVSNLWYLNFSDRGAGRLTGMTRFATFWVEHGVIVAPAPVMRFDDSLFDLLGGHLEALTQERDFLPDASTYGERQTSSVRLPGALVSGLTLTL